MYIPPVRGSDFKQVFPLKRGKNQARWPAAKDAPPSGICCWAVDATSAGACACVAKSQYEWPPRPQPR